ncbi:hypothetical protein GCM10012275_36840 [Longimycelium tulufanense]|uniref:Copper chaperone CopZ n=1 Tax=Longimycelium tulufanense TaxID=907463 RepID=A0A8J3CHM2_9PSEU|nr:heavy metal-associated domain-containing protein [Longimycelium tulufanense]GGM62738.1 hypothetical protein GCM10012275_36840 [Longimycelium tulufanense]
MADERVFTVHGMSCTGCADRIEGVLQRLEGVTRVNADHRSGVVRVRFNEQQVSENDLVERIESAGYQVTRPTPR